MKRSSIKFYPMLFFLVFFCQALVSQDLSRNDEGERIHARTDRTMYVAGEKILFSSEVNSTGDSMNKVLSRILYCELVTAGGKKITGGKYLLRNSSGQGCLGIPEETITGIYFLRFYTRFMRNAGPSGYNYIMLKIINPDKPDVVKGSTGPVASGQIMKNAVNNRGNYSITIMNGKNAFSAREEVKLRIKVNLDSVYRPGLSLSIVPEFTSLESVLSFQNLPDTVKTAIYIPEIRGISLSGQLIEKVTRKPVRNVRVNLSIIGDRDILVIRTDSSGRFFFALPDYKGSMDIFLCAEEIPGIQTEILIDNDFCTRPVSLSSPPFTLNGDEMKAAYNLAVNAGISSVFKNEVIENDTSAEQYKTPFYGKPSSVLVFDKYIDLPTLEDYFTELPVIVKIRRLQGNKQFRFFTENIEMEMFDPIVMVDWVPVNDIEKILAMSPREIDRVELVEYPYLKGNITFGGIISFVSKKNDFAGIDLPESGTFINYSFLEDCRYHVPSGTLPLNIPDSRNTVYWDPSVRIGEDGVADITFIAPDTPGNYQILLRGMTETGDEILIKELISVRK